jgi:glycosyltransferase involved in cell wall biosynthesis
MMADAVVVSSDFMARMCADNGIDSKRIAVIPPPWRPDSAASPHLALPKDRRILFSGRLVPNKGLASLINAVSKIAAERRPEIDVAGSPTREVPRLVALARRKNVTLNVLGWLEGSQMNEAIDRARVIAVPSLSPEPFGLTGIEAFARGRPVVAYASGGITEWIGRGGITVPPGNEIKLAAAIEDILEDSRWPLFARLAHREAANYTVAKHVSRLLETCGVSMIRENELALPSEYA